MKTIPLLISLTSVVLFSACSSLIKVYSEYEPGVNLFRYHTYEWRADTIPGGSNIYLSQSTSEQIRAAVDAELTTYGYKICTDQPDLLLHFHVVVENKVYYQHDWNCGDEGRAGYGMCHRVKPAYLREGTLMVDLIDVKNGNQVWRGVAVGILENVTPETRNKMIKSAVQQIFKKFPEKKWQIATK
ncbi:MAG: DUF4136 domain-containing protein [Saprospiraceae bacterium]|nr:DUF4136 domain-containing protein [Saprospiraceae bacterium]